MSKGNLSLGDTQKIRKEKIMPGELITSFRPEVQQRILANQDKYNPDKNDLIDANEIGVLLKDFSATNVKDLQNAKSLMGKINDYIFPKVDVLPAEGDGYRAVYTDGDERSFSKDEADEIKEYDGEPGARWNGRILSAGAGICGLTTIINVFDNFIYKTPRSGKMALLFGALTAAGTFLAKKCFNAADNDEEIASKMKMIDANKEFQAEKQKREEERRQQDLEYKERLNAATSGIEQSLKSSAARSRQVNAKLKDASAQTDSIMKKLNNN